MTAPLTPNSGPATGLLRAMQTTRGNTRIASVNVTHDAARRIGSIVDSTFGRLGSSFHYDSRGRLQTSVISVDPSAPGAQITDTLTAADFRSARTAPSRLSASQHALLGNALASSLEAATWNATELAGHRLDVRTASLDGAPVATIPYEFAGGRTKEGDWSVAYDEQDRLTSRTNTNLGRRINYVYDPNGRLIGRTALKANGSDWVVEDRPAVLAADALPPETTFTWDPVTDRLVSIAIAGASTQTGATPEAGLLRQYIHGDQAYDDPVEVLTSDQVNVRRYLPLIDEAGTGNVSAVLDDHGNLVERVLYADAYGDAPRYLQGPVVQRMTFAAQHTGATLSAVTVSVTLSDPIDPATLDAGVRLATLSSSNAIVSTTATAPTLLDANTLTWFLSPAEWQSLTANPAAATLEIAVTDQLRTTTWTSTPVAPAPDGTLKLFPGTAAGGSSGSSGGSTLRVSHRESLSTLAAYVATPTPHTLYEVANLYLAASATSATHLFTGFHAAPFVEPATGTAYFRKRWYDPSTGMWMSPDPLGNVDSSNLYALCGGDPVNCSDPTGTERLSKRTLELVNRQATSPEVRAALHTPQIQGASAAVRDKLTGSVIALVPGSQEASLIGRALHVVNVARQKGIRAGVGAAYGEWKNAVKSLPFVNWYFEGEKASDAAAADDAYGEAYHRVSLGIDAAGDTALVVSGVEMYRGGRAPARGPGGVPHGFRNVAEFRSFSKTLTEGLTDAGYPNAQPIFQGSSVTGVKYTTGAPFDVGRLSDFDIAIGSPELLERARAAGVELRSRGMRTGPLTEGELRALGLADLAEALSERAGRPVGFMLYESPEAAAARSPSIVVPRKR